MIPLILKKDELIGPGKNTSLNINGLLRFVERQGFICNRQFGFRAKSGTDLAAATLFYHLASIDKRAIATLTCLDLSSAFFCITYDNLRNLFDKISEGNAQRFLHQLLLPRYGVMMGEGGPTDKFQIPSCGTAQGEPTSPIIFIMAMSGCLNYTLDSKDPNTPQQGKNATMFADDMQLICHAMSVAAAIEQTYRVVDRCKEYTTNCGFRINNLKSEITIFGNPKLAKEFPEIFQSPAGPIKRKREVDVLGIRVTDKLDFKPQIEHIIGKCEWHARNIKRIKKYAIKKHILRVLFSVMMGSINYGLGIMPQWTVEQYKAAQSKLCAAIRYVLNIGQVQNQKIPDRILLKKVGILPIHIQHQRMSLMTLNRVYTNQKPADLYNIINDHLEKPSNWSPGVCNLEARINLSGPKIREATEKTMDSTSRSLK